MDSRRGENLGMGVVDVFLSNPHNLAFGFSCTHSITPIDGAEIFVNDAIGPIGTSRVRDAFPQRRLRRTDFPRTLFKEIKYELAISDNFSLADRETTEPWSFARSSL